MEKKGFVIYGTVTKHKSKEPLSGLTVEALDKDLLFDDRLGAAKTDQQGNFKITYDKKDFMDLFFDQRPDIYLQVKDADGKIIHTTKDKVKYKANDVEKFHLAVPDDLFEKPVPERERVQFKQLISINPNYFGNIGHESISKDFPVVYQLAGNTSYEQLACVGLYPEDNLLEAVIELKLPYGYGGALCGIGSHEYVAFYVDYNDGNGFVGVGAPAEVNVHDLSFVNGSHLFYAVRRAFVPKEYKDCDQPQVVKVRAILSWNALPMGPSYTPVWGDVMDAFVQIKPKESGPVIIPLPDFGKIPLKSIPIPDLELNNPVPPFPPIENFTITGEKAEIKSLIDRSLEAESKIKESGQVEPERHDFKALIAKNPNYFGSISESQKQEDIVNALDKLPQSTINAILPQLSIDPEWLIPVKPLLVNTSYEQLKCVGLHPEDDTLEAVFEVKKSNGFNGNLCTLGSREYVAFYVDWGAGYQHVGTSSVAVHDIPGANEKHLEYAVKMRIQDVASKLKSCSEENIVRVRAILSWNLDPTPFGPYHTPSWGNILERYVQIRPFDGASVTCNIEIVNEVHTGDISQSGTNEGLAIKINSGGSVVPFVFDRPFGGIVACWGNVEIPSAAYYRFRYSDDNGSSWKTITDHRVGRNPSPWIATVVRTPDSDGWFSVNEYKHDVANYSLTALLHWRSYGLDGDYLLRLEVARDDKSMLCQDEVAIKLDNTGINFFKFGGTPTPLPAEGIVVKDNGNHYKKCGTFTGDEAIKIFGNFSDDYFRSFSLLAFGGNIPVSGVGIGSGHYDSGVFDRHGNPVPALSGHIDHQGIVLAGDGGLGQQIGTLNLCEIPQSPVKVKCAYGIKLSVSDRAIIGAVHGYEYNTYHHSKHGYVTFDWDPAGC
ncbi:MAG TPA: hypothetical protein VKA27_13985 [Sunxiuqinia sp.]|nr:hypothetical protein [Sunxiuqinia sp.]